MPSPDHDWEDRGDFDDGDLSYGVGYHSYSTTRWVCKTCGLREDRKMTNPRNDSRPEPDLLPDCDEVRIREVMAS